MPAYQKVTVNKYYEIELGKVLDATLSLHNLRVQLGGIFGTLLLGISGFALSTQRAGIFFIGGILLWIFIYMDGLVRITSGYYYLRCLQLQQQLANKDPDAFVGTFYTIRPKAQEKIRQLVQISDIKKRNRILESIMGLRYDSYVGFWVPLIASTVLIVFGLYLWLLQGWLLF